MATGSFLKLNEYDTSLVNEISAMSTFKPTTVRTILESALMRQVESLLKGDEVQIPFLGKLKIEYVGDDFISGAKLAKINVTFEPSDLLVRLAGEAHDGESDLIWQLSERKIRSAAQKKLEE